VAGPHEEGGSDGGIDAPAHSDDDALGHEVQSRAPSNPAKRSSSSGFA